MPTTQLKDRRLSALAAPALALAGLVIAVGALSSNAGAAPVSPAGSGEFEAVSIDKGGSAIPIDGDFALDVQIEVDQPTGYLESRLQIHRPDGGLLLQKTEVRNDVATGTVDISYERDLSSFSLEPGAYPMELRVRSDASGLVREWVVEDDLLLFDPESPPLRLALVTRVVGPPLADTEGRFVADPAQYARPMEQAEAAAAITIANEDILLNLALPPVLADEWLRASGGYEIATPEGIVTVSAEDGRAEAHSAALNLVSAALSTDRLELMDIPFADPDAVGLHMTGRGEDLGRQFERGQDAYLAALDTSPSGATMLANGLLTRVQAATMRARSKGIVLVSAAALEDTSSANVDLGSGLAGFVIDPAASDALRSAEATTFARALFEHHAAGETTHTIVAVAEVGTGRALNLSELEECVAELAAGDWVEMELLSQTPTADLPVVAVVPTPSEASEAPGDYWNLVADARVAADALVFAMGDENAIAQSAVDSSLLAQSSLWAGGDGTWSLAERGRSHASAAARTASALLGGVRVSATDITLSSAQGEVPVSITNPTEEPLNVIVRTSSEGVSLPGPSSREILLRPADTFLTLPVDLQSALVGEVHIEIWAADLMLHQTDVAVRASYLDRLVIIAGVLLVLAALLLLIRRRAKSADADSIEQRGLGSEAHGAKADEDD